MQKYLNNHTGWLGAALVLFVVLGVASPASATSWFWPQSSATKTGKMSTVLVIPEATQIYASLPPATVAAKGAWGSPSDQLTVQDQQDQIKLIKSRTAALKESTAAKDAQRARRQRLMALADKTRPLTAGRVNQNRPAITQPGLPTMTRPQVKSPNAPVAPTTIQPILPKRPAYQTPPVPAGDWEKVSPNPATGTGSGNGIQPIIIPNRNLKNRATQQQQAPVGQPASQGAPQGAQVPGAAAQ